MPRRELRSRLSCRVGQPDGSLFPTAFSSFGLDPSSSPLDSLTPFFASYSFLRPSSSNRETYLDALGTLGAAHSTWFLRRQRPRDHETALDAAWRTRVIHARRDEQRDGTAARRKRTTTRGGIARRKRATPGRIVAASSLLLPVLAVKKEEEKRGRKRRNAPRCRSSPSVVGGGVRLYTV